MNISQYINARNDFFSDLESPEMLSLAGPDLTDNLTLVLKDIKGLAYYLSTVLAMEPIFGAENIFINATIAHEDESLSFWQFKRSTQLNNVKTFMFQATTFANKVPLKFIDKALLGGENTYKPFGSSELSPLNSMATANLHEIRTFSDTNYKLSSYKGIIAFDRATVHKKGYVIKITNRHFRIVIIASKYDFKKGLTSYIGLLVAEA